MLMIPTLHTRQLAFFQQSVYIYTYMKGPTACNHHQEALESGVVLDCEPLSHNKA